MPCLKGTALLCTLLVASAYADEPAFTNSLVVKAKVLSNDKISTQYDQTVHINAAAVIGALSQVSIPMNQAFWNFKVLTAETVKKDGRHIKVPADKILKGELPNAPNMATYQADMKNTTIVFPDVEVGDSVHFVTEKTSIKPEFPGGFTLVVPALAQFKFEQYRVELDAPARFTPKVEARGFNRADTGLANGRQLTTWTLAPAFSQTAEHGPKNAELLVSTYADWSQIGQTFRDMANPMSEPSEEVRQLAERVTAGLPDRRAKAQAIFDWVSTNIRYFNILLGYGGFVPHPAAEVLQNKYGDCKDHVTLMRAMLKAINIESDYVLIPLQSFHKTPTVPSISWFNHVVLYLPEFDAYADPTSTYSSFAHLPVNEADLPILHIKQDGAVLSRSPALYHGAERVVNELDLYFKPDFSVHGVQHIQASGALAELLRVYRAQAEVKGNSEFVKEQLHVNHLEGTGRLLNVSSRIDHANPYQIDIEFDLVKDGKNSALALASPRGLSPFRYPYVQFLLPVDHATQSDSLCVPYSYTQKIRVHAPSSVRFRDLPAGLRLKTDQILYHSEYADEDGVLEINRFLDVNLTHQMCSRAEVEQLIPDLTKVRQDFLHYPQARL